MNPAAEIVDERLTRSTVRTDVVKPVSESETRYLVGDVCQKLGFVLRCSDDETMWTARRN